MDCPYCDKELYDIEDAVKDKVAKAYNKGILRGMEIVRNGNVYISGRMEGLKRAVEIVQMLSWSNGYADPIAAIESEIKRGE